MNFVFDQSEVRDHRIKNGPKIDENEIIPESIIQKDEK
jgi:hypothetical protein